MNFSINNDIMILSQTVFLKQFLSENEKTGTADHILSVTQQLNKLGEG